MIGTQLRGLIVAIYGVLLDIFSLHNLIPLFAEDSLSSEEKSILIWWIILWVASTIIIGIGSSIIKSAEPSTTIKSSNSPVALKTCANCGTENSGTSNHCYKCGKAFQSQTNNNITGSEWKCPSCGQINQNYVGTCGCGQVKPR